MNTPTTATPFTHIGFQAGFGKVAGFDLFNLNVAVRDYPVGSTVTRETLISLGFSVPAMPAAKPVDEVNELLRERRRAAWYRRNYDYAGYRAAA